MTSGMLRGAPECAPREFLGLKTLSGTDLGHMRVVLPKALAEGGELPRLTEAGGEIVVLFDSRGVGWPLRFKFWPNKKGRMYVLEGARGLIEAHALEVHDTLNFMRRGGRFEFDIIRQGQEKGDLSPGNTHGPGSKPMPAQCTSSDMESFRMCQKQNTASVAFDHVAQGNGLIEMADIVKKKTPLLVGRAWHVPCIQGDSLEKHVGTRGNCEQQGECMLSSSPVRTRNGEPARYKRATGEINSSSDLETSSERPRMEPFTCATCVALKEENREMFDELQRRREELHFLKAALINILGHPLNCRTSPRPES